MIRCGEAPFLECSSKGDKRFSAFFARIRSRGNRSIEDIYQGAKVFPDGRTGLTWREAKGKSPINRDEVAELYHQLWLDYLNENLELVEIILTATGVSDIFGQPGRQCQASTLWDIRAELLK